MEHQTIVGMEDETKERLSKLRVQAASQSDPEMLWAIEAEVSFLSHLDYRVCFGVERIGFSAR